MMRKEHALALCSNEAQIFKCASPDAACYISRKRGHVGSAFCAHPGHESDRVVLSKDVSLLDFPGMGLDEALTILPSTSANSNIGALSTRISNMCTAVYEYHAPAEMIIMDSCIHEDQGTEKTVLTIQGRVLKGVLKKKQQLEIRPGSFSHDDNGQIMCNPVIINVATLDSIGGNDQLEQAAAGDMITVRSNIDYEQIGGIVADMSGFVIGHVDSLPDVLSALKLKVILLPLMFDSYTEDFKEVSIIEKGEVLLVTVGMLSAAAEVRKVVDETTVVVTLKSPICARKEDKVLLLRSANVCWRLIGHGQIEDATVIKIGKAIHG
ncbi:hypothetical protein VPH35_073452 [Triticum aestivum]